MQEQRRLQRRRLHIRPQDRQVQPIQHARVMERVPHERHQAENIKVGRLRRRPPSKQHIQADRQVHQPNQPLQLVIRPVRRHQVNRNIQSNRVRPVRRLPHHRVRRVSPHTRQVHLMHCRRHHRRRRPVDRRQNVALPDPRLVRRRVRRHNIGLQPTRRLNPPRTVRRRRIVVLLDQVRNRKPHRPQRHHGKQDGQQTGLGTGFHG